MRAEDCPHYLGFGGGCWREDGTRFCGDGCNCDCHRVLLCPRDESGLFMAYRIGDTEPKHARSAPQWTTSPPTKPGWYWVRNPGYEAHAVFVIDADLHGLLCYAAGQREHMSKFKWWSGPIEPPKFDVDK